MVNISEYELLSIETNAFEDIELDILKESLKVWKENPGNPYELTEMRDGRILAGFCLFYKTMDTEYSFDIHSFVVSSIYRNTALGGSLLSLVLEKISGMVNCGVLRVETSRNKELSVGDGFFQAHGFQLMGHIPDFYKSGNDYYIYVKQICQAEPGTVLPSSSEFHISRDSARFRSA